MIIHLLVINLLQNKKRTLIAMTGSTPQNIQRSRELSSLPVSLCRR